MAKGKKWYGRAAVPAVVVLLLMLSACGGDEAHPDAHSGATEPTRPATTTPSAPTLTAPAEPVATQQQLSIQHKPNPTPTAEEPEPDRADDSAETNWMQLAVPALSVNAPVIPIAMDDGVLTPPSNTSTVGWWSQGARPGAATGTAVLVGHAVHTGGGVFNNLDTVDPGNTVTVQTDDGPLDYTVTRVEVFHKSELPDRAQEVFGQSGPGRLVLVSCDDWDGSVWESNVVVFAKPSSG